MKKIAIHLPQFHPIPENDSWWGKGFTEWTNVTKSKPRFEDHYQPQLPSDLGFYDLRLAEARLAQEQLAKQYDIHGFCYYHYWFNGKRLLHEPLDRKLQNPQEDLPFMLCWANENWARNWDGGNQHILLQQNYSPEDDVQHIRHLLTYFKDERYIRVNGKAFFAIYKPDLFPDIKNTLRIFREEAAKEQIELYLVWFDRSLNHGQANIKAGFDCAIEFQPFLQNHKQLAEKTRKALQEQQGLVAKYESKLKNVLKKQSANQTPSDTIIDYALYVEQDIQSPEPDYPRISGICPGWDNACRRENLPATIFIHNTPDEFRKWYTHKKTSMLTQPAEQQFLFINAWNEWAEGNHLEPCRKWGTQFLEALQD